MTYWNLAKISVEQIKQQNLERFQSGKKKVRKLIIRIKFSSISKSASYVIIIDAFCKPTPATQTPKRCRFCSIWSDRATTTTATTTTTTSCQAFEKIPFSALMRSRQKWSLITLLMPSDKNGVVWLLLLLLLLLLSLLLVLVFLRSCSCFLVVVVVDAVVVDDVTRKSISVLHFVSLLLLIIILFMLNLRTLS